MRRIVLLVALCAVVAAGAASAARTPSLRIVRAAPLTVTGAGYVPGEGVTVTLTVGGKLRARLPGRAGATGAFSVRFRSLIATDVCHGWLIVRAAGTSGSLASVKRECRTPDPQLP